MKFSKLYEKLEQTIFTTIRKNTGRYKLGLIYTIQTPLDKFKAKVIGLYPIRKADITEDLAEVDADTNKLGMIHLLERWYGKAFDDYILITFWVDDKWQEKEG